MPQGAPNTRYKWSANQHKILKEEMESFRTNIADIINIDDPQTAALTSWKQQRAQEIMELPEFKGQLDFSENPEVQWCKAIVAKFTNTWNTKIAGKVVKNVKKGKVKHATNAESELMTDDEDRRMTRLLRAFALFSSEIKPRDLFARENEDDLKRETTRIMKEKRAEPSFTAAARNIALSNLWHDLTTAERNVWHRRAQMMADDVVANRKEFPTLIAETLQTLCNRGRLGTAIMALNYAFRDEHDGLVSGAVYVGTDVVKKMKCAIPMKTHDEWFNLWKEHAQEVVPDSVASKHSLIKMSTDGVPLFPEIVERKASPEQVAGSLMAYITAFWDFASPASEGRDRVLWKQIDMEPELYYDTDTFKLPANLKAIVEVTDVLDIYALVAYFRTLQAQGTPFHFYQRSEVDDDERSDDDNDIMPPLHLSPEKRSASMRIEPSGSMPSTAATNNNTTMEGQGLRPAPSATVPVTKDPSQAPVTPSATAANNNPVTEGQVEGPVPGAAAPAIDNPPQTPSATPVHSVNTVNTATELVPAPGDPTSSNEATGMQAPAAATDEQALTNIEKTAKKQRGRPPKAKSGPANESHEGTRKALRSRNQKRPIEDPKPAIQPPKKKAKTEKGMKGFAWVPIEEGDKAEGESSLSNDGAGSGL